MSRKDRRPFGEGIDVDDGRISTVSDILSHHPTVQAAEEGKKWAESVRSWHRPGASGITRVSFKMPAGEHGQTEMIGIAFPDGAPPTKAEKELMQFAIQSEYGLNRGLSYQGGKGFKFWATYRTGDAQEAVDEIVRRLDKGRSEPGRAR